MQSTPMTADTELNATITQETPESRAEALLATIEELHQQVWAAASELLVDTVTDAGETYEALRCPVCQQLVTDPGELRAVDISTRWNSAEPDMENRQIDITSGDDDYGSTLYYIHWTGDAHAVIPPSGWSEDWCL